MTDILSLYFRSQKELLIGGVKEITVRVEVENKAQDAAYPGKVIVTYPSIIDYVGSQVGPCEKNSHFNFALVVRFSKPRRLRSFRGVSEDVYEGDPTTLRRISLSTSFLMGDYNLNFSADILNVVLLTSMPARL